MSARVRNEVGDSGPCGKMMIWVQLPLLTHSAWGGRGAYSLTFGCPRQLPYQSLYLLLYHTACVHAFEVQRLLVQACHHPGWMLVGCSCGPQYTCQAGQVRPAAHLVPACVCVQCLQRRYRRRTWTQLFQLFWALGQCLLYRCWTDEHRWVMILEVILSFKPHNT
jgi:hypothetical protein